MYSWNNLHKILLQIFAGADEGERMIKSNEKEKSIDMFPENGKTDTIVFGLTLSERISGRMKLNIHHKEKQDTAKAVK